MKSKITACAALVLPLLCPSLHAAGPDGIAPVADRGLHFAASPGTRNAAPNAAIADVGAIAPGTDSITRHFVLCNDGASPLTIREAQPSCNCTTTEFSADTPSKPPIPRQLPCVLKPGQRIGLDVTVHLANRTPGGFVNAVFIFIEGEPKYASLLQIRGSVAIKP